jgi:acetyl-CoA acetyltransferase
MAETAENLVREKGIDRAAQYAYALRSQQRAGAEGRLGVRLCTTAILELRRRGAERALVSLCVGVGPGVALGPGRPS